MSKTRRMCYAALLAAMYVPLSLYVAVQVGNVRISFGSLPVVVSALLFGPVEAVTVAMVGEFFKQLLTYGVTYTTVLYLIPPALRGLVDMGEDGKALQYIDQLADSSALRGGRRLCENDAANAVLSAKAEAMGRTGLTADFAVSLPKDLSLSDVDLCALLGNAADNAMEAAEQAADKTVTLRCRAEKGLFMLRVENAYAGELAPDLATTKADRTSHGFGLAGMREIAERLGGSLETRAGGVVSSHCGPGTLGVLFIA